MVSRTAIQDCSAPAVRPCCSGSRPLRTNQPLKIRGFAQNICIRLQDLNVQDRLIRLATLRISNGALFAYDLLSPKIPRANGVPYPCNATIYCESYGQCVQNYKSLNKRVYQRN